MELFNYISAAVSIVLAISIAHLLSGLRDVVAPGRRDWLVVGWYGYLAYFHLLTWWSLFAAHESSAWNLGTFALAMMVPSLLYLALHTLISEAPTAVPSWRAHFEKVRPWFFTFFALFIATSAVRETVLPGRPILGMASGFGTISVLNATVGAVSSHGRVQVAVLAIELSLAFLISAERFYGRTLPFRCDFNFFHPSFDFDRVVRPSLLPSDVSVADLLLQGRKMRRATVIGPCMVSGSATRD